MEGAEHLCGVDRTAGAGDGEGEVERGGEIGRHAGVYYRASAGRGALWHEQRVVRASAFPLLRPISPGKVVARDTLIAAARPGGSPTA